MEFGHIYMKNGNVWELTALFKGNRYLLITTLLLETNLAHWHVRAWWTPTKNNLLVLNRSDSFKRNAVIISTSLLGTLGTWKSKPSTSNITDVWCCTSAVPSTLDVIWFSCVIFSLPRCYIACAAYIVFFGSSCESGVCVAVFVCVCPWVPKSVYLACHWGQVQGWVAITSTGSAQDKQGLFLLSPGATISW